MQQHHANVVGGDAADARITGHAIAAVGAGVVYQRRYQRRCQRIGRYLTGNAQAAAGGVVRRVGHTQVEAIGAQRQWQAAEVEAAIGACCRRGDDGAAAAAAQRQRGTGFGDADQRDDVGGGPVVADDAGVAGGVQPEADEHRRDGVGRHASELRQRSRVDIHAAHLHGRREHRRNHAAAAQ